MQVRREHAVQTVKRMPLVAELLHTSLIGRLPMPGAIDDGSCRVIPASPPSCQGRDTLEDVETTGRMGE